MQSLKRLSPSLSKLVAQVVHERHRAEAVRETAQLRELLAELIRRGRKPEDLARVIVTGDTSGLV